MVSRSALSLLMTLMLLACAKTPRPDPKSELMNGASLEPLKGAPSGATFLTKNYRGVEMLIYLKGEGFSSNLHGNEAAELKQLLVFAGKGILQMEKPLAHTVAKAVTGKQSSLIVIARNRKSDRRLDLLSDSSPVRPEDRLPKIAYLGSDSGNIYTTDHKLTRRVLENEILMNRLLTFRDEYIRVDDQAVSFMVVARPERMAEIVESQGGYAAFVTNAMDTVAMVSDVL